jgi:hypothetical protein
VPRIATLSFLLYLVLLTAGLLLSNPFALAGSGQGWLREFYDAYLEGMGHFLGFFVLGVLASASRWPAKFGTRMMLLGAYAVATEVLQNLVPDRTPELNDLLQNLAGAAVGAVVGWMMMGTRQASVETGERRGLETGERRGVSPTCWRRKPGE